MKVVCQLWTNIAQVISMCNVGPDRSRQHCRLFFRARLFVDRDQHYTGIFLGQCWLKQIKVTLYMVIFLQKNDYVVWSNISLVVLLCNLSQTYLDNIDQTVDYRTTSSEAAISRCSSKQVFLKTSQYSQKNNLVGISF